MCNTDCIRWGARNLSREELRGKRIIEVGSFDANGSLRYVLEKADIAEYVGADIIEGPGVDVVCPAEDLVKHFGSNSFDIVVSTCALEHIREWKTSVSNIKCICRPGGTMLIAVPASWPYHAYPHDFWRYTADDLRAIFSDCEILVLDQETGRESLTYAKVRKPEAFVENDLSGIAIYSVVTAGRTRELCDEDFDCPHFRRMERRKKWKELRRKLKFRL